MELAYKDDWSEAQDRFKAWWAGEVADRVALAVTAPKQPAQPIAGPESLIERWTSPEYLIAKNEETFRCTYYGGEAFPKFFVNLGPSIMGAYLGCPLHFAEDTAWQRPIVQDWDEADIRFDAENRWWQLTKQLTAAAVEGGADKFFVSITDLGGSGDVLSYLRTPRALCFDLIERADVIERMRDFLVKLWFRLYDELLETIHTKMHGSSGWLSVWSPGKTYPLQCDFSCMISPQMFKRFFLPEIQAQAQWLDHSIYHLDGPGAVQHLDLLLDIPELGGIQWVPGTGAPPAIGWIPLLEKIQKAGKLYHLSVEPNEVERLLSELSAKGLFLSTSCSSVEEARDLLKKAARWSKERR